MRRENSIHERTNLCECLCWHVLATRQLQGDLHGVGVNVVKVLHSAGNVVPLGAVGDSTGEAIPAMVAFGHESVVPGVQSGNVSAAAREKKRKI